MDGQKSKCKKNVTEWLHTLVLDPYEVRSPSGFLYQAERNAFLTHCIGTTLHTISLRTMVPRKQMCHSTYASHPANEAPV